MPQPKEANYYTFADSLAWKEGDHIELLHGEPIMMAPPSRIHQKICGELHRQIANYLEGKECEVYIAPFAVRLFEQSSDSTHDVDTVVEPDLSVICDTNKLDDYGCKGAPDMVIEVLSPSTRRHDQLVKFNLYQRAGVFEYWIVDPDAKSIQTFVLEDGRYSAKDFGAPENVLKINALDGCFIELSRVF